MGIGLGAISYFISPLVLLALLGSLVMAYCILKTPEIGVIVMILILPFAPVGIVQLCVTFVFVCYILKLIAGKRTFKFEYFDIWVVVVLAVTVIRGSISSAPISSLRSVLTNATFIMSYFIVTNLVLSKVWFRRCLIAMVMAGLAVSVVAIVQFIIGELSVRFLDLGRIFTRGQSVTAFFEEPDAFAHYLVAIIPFTLVHFISERVKTKKTIGFTMGAILIIAMAFTHSLSGVVGLLCAALLLVIIFNRNFTYLALGTVLTVPLLYYTLPKNALDKILSKKIFEGVSSARTVEEIRTSFKMVISKPFGVGSGTAAFESGFDVSQGYSDNLMFQVLFEYGVIGFVAFTLFIIMLMRLTFSYCVKAKNQYRKINCCAGFCSVTGLISSGLMCYVWQDRRLYLLFWLLVALSFAYMRIERQEEEPKGVSKDYTAATLDIILVGESHHDVVPVRRYVHVPRGADEETDDIDVKEFVPNEEEILKAHSEEEEKQENGEAEQQED